MKHPTSEKRPVKAKRLSRPRGAAATKDVPVLVLTVLRAVHEATRNRAGLYYVGVADLGLAADDQERTDAAALLAHLSGWLTAGGNTPHSVAITWDGLALLKERGLA